MSCLTRRDLFSSGLALSASSLLTRSAWARTAALLGEQGTGVAAASIAPRERLLFDFGWKFKFGNGSDPVKDLGFGFGQSDFSKTGNFKFSKAGFDDSGWRLLNLPHDWAVELPFVHDDAEMGQDSSLRSHGYKPLGRRYPETSVGWYRREFEIPAGDLGRRISVEYDGAFRDVLVFVNGCFVGRNNDGYAQFRFDTRPPSSSGRSGTKSGYCRMRWLSRGPKSPPAWCACATSSIRRGSFLRVSTGTMRKAFPSRSTS